MLGFNSLQSLITLLQSEVKPDYVVTFNGWTEIDQAIYSRSKVASLAQACDARANGSTVKKLLNNFLKRLITVQVFKRFFFGFLTYNDVVAKALDTSNIDVCPPDKT